MCGGADPDLVTYSIWDEIARNEYLENDNLMEVAQNRYEEVGVMAIP